MSTSRSIYSAETVPYFYIIEHISSGKQYAGSKWAKRSNPKTFLTEYGYKTSSKEIRSIIKTEGLQSFRIVQLLTEAECGMPVYDYETQFLQSNNIAQHPGWFNKHNNNADLNNEKIAERRVQSTRARMLSSDNPGRHKPQERRELARYHKLKQLEQMSPEDRKRVFGSPGSSNPSFGTKHKESSLQKMSKAHEQYEYSITSPTGEKFSTTNLRQFCKQHQLNLKRIYLFVDKCAVPPSHKQAKLESTGWFVQRVNSI